MISLERQSDAQNQNVTSLRTVLDEALEVVLEIVEWCDAGARLRPPSAPQLSRLLGVAARSELRVSRVGRVRGATAACGREI